jgi:myotubularin-related protein 1/2
LRAAFGEDLKFHVSLAESQWYDFVFLILSGAVEIAKNLTKGINNLVHCSDGWDRTAQLCALSGIMLDPFYRTIEGFEILIEKDWIHFGHQFGVRLAQGMNNPSG